MLITFALILIMTILLYGSGSRSQQDRQKKNCQKNLLTLHIALEIFANEHDGSFPIVAGAQTSEEPLDLLVPHYTADTGPFICPGSKDSPLPSGEPLSKGRISYAYFMGRRLTDSQEALMSDRQVNTQPKQAGQLIFSSTGKRPGSNHHKYGGNCLFGDGHVETSSATVPFSLVWTQGVVLLNPKL
jgi:prepilin-type processing-associated H-X9-DG protein